ncbi:unnamed protein product [Peniophora sp. CBMAI 1063]|nr:unnamed protein product [Peniophora sp. CBMAI 1063]
MNNPSPDNDLDPLNRFWSLYLKQADMKDRERSERWKGDTEGILIFVRDMSVISGSVQAMTRRQTGLFASTVASFVIASYPALSPDSGEETVALLRQLVTLMNATHPTDVPAPHSAPAFSASTTDVWVNALWFVSLIVSISCALLAIMIQQWIRQYSLDTHRGITPSARGPIQSLLCTGTQRFKMEDALELVTLFVHVSVALFFAGLIVQLKSLNGVIGTAATTLASFIAAAYIALSILPLIYLECPYRTPLTAITDLAIVLSITFCTNVASGVDALIPFIVAKPKHLNVNPRLATYWKGRLEICRRDRAELLKARAVHLPFKVWFYVIGCMWKCIDNVDEMGQFFIMVAPMIEPRLYEDQDNEQLADVQKYEICSLLFHDTDILVKAAVLMRLCDFRSCHPSELPDRYDLLAKSCLFIRAFVLRVISGNTAMPRNTGSLADPANGDECLQVTKAYQPINQLIHEIIDHPMAQNTGCRAVLHSLSTYIVAYVVQSAMLGITHAVDDSRITSQPLPEHHCAPFNTHRTNGPGADCTMSFAGLSQRLAIMIYHIPDQGDCTRCRLLYLVAFLLSIASNGADSEAYFTLNELSMIWQPFLGLLHVEGREGFNPVHTLSGAVRHPPVDFVRTIISHVFDHSEIHRLRRDPGPSNAPTVGGFPRTIRSEYVDVMNNHPILLDVLKDLALWSGIYHDDCTQTS